jgi:hypothetical protein
MKASLVAYDLEELHKNSELKTMKINYFKGYPKCLAIQIWSLKILGDKNESIVQVIVIEVNHIILKKILSLTNSKYKAQF